SLRHTRSLRSPLPYTTLFRSYSDHHTSGAGVPVRSSQSGECRNKEQSSVIRNTFCHFFCLCRCLHNINLISKPLYHLTGNQDAGDRKSTRLNSSHVSISYAVF